MASEVVIPRLGWTMEVGQLVEWLKRDGETVEAGEAIFTVESDKAVSEVEALDSGILRIPPDSPAAGVELPVGTLLAYVVPPGQPAPFDQGNAVPPSAADPLPPDPSRVAPPTPAEATPGIARRSRNGTPPISPRARRLAAELGIDWAVLGGSGTTGRIVERDIQAAATRSLGVRPRVTPVVQRAADEAGVDLARLAAERPGGRVTRSDVRAAAASTAASVAPSAAVTPMGPIRRLTAQRMTESVRAAAPVTLTTDANATELVRVRANVAADLAGTEEPVPSFTDLLTRLVALALREHPALNASWADDGITLHAAVHVGIAVDAERGLVVPVLRDAQAKSVHQIATESARLIAQTRAGTIAPADVRGATFTITNLGMYDIDAFTPIINLPECAILGVGRIVARPVVLDDATEEVAVRKMMALSLTFDHRVVDGAPAARFLQRVRRLVERPYGWLLR